MLNKSQAVLERNRWHDHGDRIHFDAGDEDDGCPSIVLRAGEWEDMGRPEQVTVTIEPGNTLNPSNRVSTVKYWTKSGKGLTDADIEALADEAERGYDVSHLDQSSNRRVR